MSINKQDPWKSLEDSLKGDTKTAMEELFADCNEEIPDLSEPVVVLNKEFKQPDDEIAYEIWLSIPQTFIYKEKEWEKNAFTKFLVDKNINTKCSKTMAEIKRRIDEEQMQNNMKISDDDMADLLSMMSTAPVETPITVQEIAIEKEEEVAPVNVDQLYRMFLQLQDRVQALEEENKLLKNINKALSQKEETIMKSNNTVSDQLSIDDVLNTLLPEEFKPKKRRGRPKGHTVSEATKAKQRAARNKKLNKAIQENLRFHLTTECHGTIGTVKVNYKLHNTTDKGYIFQCQDMIGSTWEEHAQFIKNNCGEGVIDCQWIFVPKGSEQTPMQNWSEHKA